MKNYTLLFIIALLCTSCSSASSDAPDSQIIKEKPQKFLLSKDDLDDITGKSLCYYINENWINLNFATPASGTEPQSFPTQKDLGDAAWIYFKRGSGNCDQINAPADWISYIVAKFGTTRAAQLELSENNATNSNDSDSWSVVNNEDFIVGDLSIIEYKKSTYPKDSNKVHYAIEFAFYNYVVKIEVEGLESKTTLNFIKEIAEKQLYKLQKDVVAIQ
jgi:hypothetical protein